MVRGAFEYQGQKCSAASRCYIPSDVWNDIEQDYLKAYAWAGVVAARGFKPAEEIRDKIEGKFTSEQLIEARLLAKNFWNLHVKE